VLVIVISLVVVVVVVVDVAAIRDFASGVVESLLFPIASHDNVGDEDAAAELIESFGTRAA
jgi:hypothetical protein